MVDAEGARLVLGAALAGARLPPPRRLRDAASARVAAAALGARRAALADAAAARGGGGGGEALLGELLGAAQGGVEGEQDEASCEGAGDDDGDGDGAHSSEVVRLAAAWGSELLEALEESGVDTSETPLAAAAELADAVAAAARATREAEVADAVLEGASPAFERYERAVASGDLRGTAAAAADLRAAATALEERFSRSTGPDDGGMVWGAPTGSNVADPAMRMVMAVVDEADTCHQNAMDALQAGFVRALAVSADSANAQGVASLRVRRALPASELLAGAQEHASVTLADVLGAAADLRVAVPLADAFTATLLEGVVTPLLARPLELQTNVAEGGELLVVNKRNDLSVDRAGDKCAAAEAACSHALAVLRFVAAGVGQQADASDDTGVGVSKKGATAPLLKALWESVCSTLLSGPLAAAVPTELDELARFKTLGDRTVALESDVMKLFGEEILEDGAGAAGALSVWASESDTVFARQRGAAALMDVRDALIRSAKAGGGEGRRLESRLDRTVGFMAAAAELEGAGEDDVDAGSDTDQCAYASAIPLCPAFSVSEGAIAAAAAADACMADAAAAAAKGATSARDAFVDCALACLDMPRALMMARVAASGGAARCEMLFSNDCAFAAHCAVMLAAVRRAACGDAAVAKLVAASAPLRREADEARAEAAQNHDAEIASMLDAANGFSDAGADAAGPCALPRAIASVDDMLRKLARAWGDVADEEIASETLSFLVDESLDRFASEVLMQREIGVKDCEALHTLAVAASQWIDAGRGALPGGGNLDLDAPQCLRVKALAQLLDAGLADIPESWESGMLSAAGMGQEEVSSLVRAVFAESELRRSVLARITA